MSKVQKTISDACKENGVSVHELLSDSRRSEVVAVRRTVAIKLIDDLKMSYAATGRALNRDPSRICQMVGAGHTR